MVIKPPLTQRLTLRCSVKKPLAGRPGSDTIPGRSEERFQELSGMIVLKGGKTVATVTAQGIEVYVGDVTVIGDVTSSGGREIG